MNVDRIVEALLEAFPDAKIAAQPMPIGETCVALPACCIRLAAKMLIERFDLVHLSAITALDKGGTVELLYHFWGGLGLTLRIALPREADRRAHIPTLIDMIPGAAFYEREAAEMVGITFDGHHELIPLLLPDDWLGKPPLLHGEEENR